MDASRSDSPQDRHFSELEVDYVRAKLEEGFAAIERGEVEDWDSASIKADGRQLLNDKCGGSAF